jgi:glycosyltransferase involved in cell wall biosynthesis
MRIGINALGQISERAGGRVYYFNIVKNLAQLDKKNIYIIFLSSKREDIFEINQKNFIKVFCCPFAQKEGYFKLFAEIFILPFLVKKYKLDIFYSCGNLIPLFCPAKTILVIHDLRFFYKFDDFQRKTIKKYFYPFFVKRANKIISISNTTTADIIKFIHCPKDKITTIQPGADLTRFSPRIEAPPHFFSKIRMNQNEKFILFVSSLFPRKNAHGLIRAYEILIRKYKIPQKLVIAGKIDQNYEPFLKNLCQKLKVSDKVIFTGFIDNNELPYLYQISDIFVFPSLFEGFGIPLVEAMASGTPVVAINATTTPEIVGDAGLIVEPDDIDGLAKAIFNVLNNPDLRKDLISKGLERVKQFSWEKTAKEILKVFEEVYAQK